MVKENISLEFDKCTLKVRHKTRSSEDLKESELHVEHETIRTGSLYYEKHRIDSRHLPFMLTPYTVDMEKVLNILFHDWHLPDPKVIIFALAEAEYSLSDEYRRLSRKLVKGLVHALNTTEMWLCTDGLNHGFSRDVGKAFEDEMSKREMVESSKYSVFPETALLGICSRNNLTFSEKFGPQKSEEVGEKTEKEEFKRDINKRYEYFIFLEDSTEMKKGVSTETKKGVSTETKKGVSTETIKGVAHFLLNFASHLTKPKENTTDQNNRKPETPVIALLLQGPGVQYNQQRDSWGGWRHSTAGDRGGIVSLESLAPKINNNRDYQPELRGRGACSTGSLSDHPSLTRTVRSRLSQAFARFTDIGNSSNNASANGGERVVWEYHTVTLARVSGYGFGIAVSGGKDSPHFSSGDPAIAISDVLKAGPAEGKLQINDRLVSANGISLENVDYTRAVQVLRECGNSVNLVIKRKVTSTNNSSNSQSVKVTLTKSKKKDDFGIVLGCRIYVKEITNQSNIEKDGTVHEGDIILKINSSSTDSMTLKEARKLIENTKEKLQLVIKRDSSNTFLTNTNGQLSNDYSSPSPPNSFDAIGERSHWSNQNLYVQPPTRGETKPPPPPLPDRTEDKNNLTRLQSGRNRGPIMDISLSQLDQPATPLLTGHGHSRAPVGLEDEEPLQRPSLPRIDEFSGHNQFDEDPLARRNKTIQPEPRFISFQKDGSVGIRLTGGNEVGVFVTAVQPGSPASLQGLQPGDKILKVNEMDMHGVTREDAVLYLLNIQDFVNLIVQHLKEEYDEIVANQKGDSFYIRTHFSYEGSGKGEIAFHVGEVFHVTDTLHNGVVGSWQVYRLGRNNQEIQKGVIPNRNRAEQWAQEQQNQAKKDAAAESRGSFFKRRSARRSKSLSKDHWEDVVFADGISKFPAYERVTLKHPGFIRPVVLFGALADVARDKLLKDYPDKYASPQLDGHLDDVPKSQKSSGIIRLSAIKEIIEKGKHAVLDITPSAVDRLNYAQFYPIVIFMRAENKHTVKELRSRLAKSSHKSSKKLYDHAVKLEKLWSHIFTATITLTSADMWYKKLRETIDKQQQLSIWVSESKPEEAISDDFLFPMTSRLSYASSPESDLELATDSRPSGLQDLGLPGTDRHMVKASSDPSIATQEEMSGPPGYNQLPGYSTARSRQLPFEFLQQQDSLPLASDSRDSISPAKYNPGGETISKGRTAQPEPPPRVDRTSKPTHYRTAQERLFARGRHSLLIEAGRDQREPPDYINTGGAQPHSLERSNGRLGAFDSSSYSSDSYNQYSSNPNDKNRGDMYNSSSGMNNRSPHDPYRYTRSTTQPPAKPMNMDRGRVPPPNKFRHPEERPTPPSPPPKPANYAQRMSDGRPVPPPKPGHYQSRPWRPEDDVPPPPHSSMRPPPPPQHDYSTSNHRSSEVMPPPYTPNQRNRNSLDFMGSPPYYTPRSYNPNDMLVMPPKHSPPPPVPDDQHDNYRNPPLGSPSRRPYKSDDNSGFDSGRGSSLDRNYDVRSYTKAMGNPPSWPAVHMNGGGPYHNVPYRGPPRRDPIYPPPYDHHSSPPQPPPSSLIDLSNRENRGSAFELYKKPDSRSPMGLQSLTNAGAK